jgi:hypothetical protein
LNREERAVGEDVERDRAAGIREMAAVEGLRRTRASAELGKGARRAVLGGLEVADDVVVLEGRRDQEQDVEGHSSVRHAPDPTMSQPPIH